MSADGDGDQASLEQLQHEVEGLRQALESRDAIGQAKGILMERQGCTADEAFDILRRGSQRENRKLREIAIDIIAASGRRRANAGSDGDGDGYRGDRARSEKEESR